MSRLRLRSSTEYAVLVLGHLMVPGAVSVHAQGAAGRSVPEAATTLAGDQQHPANFVIVMEQTAADRLYCLYAPSDATRSGCTIDHSTNNPSAEIDRRSRLVIRFDRGVLLSGSIANSNIRLEAHLTKADGSRPPLEIPGYSEVGQDARVVPVRLRLGREILMSMADLERTTAGLRVRLDSISRLATAQEESRTATVLKDLEAAQARVTALTDSIARLSQQIEDSLRLANDVSTWSAEAGATSDTSARARHVYAASQRLTDSLEALKRRRDSSAVRANDLSGGLRSPDQSRAVRQKIALQWRDVLLDARRMITSQIQEVTRDSVVFDALARLQMRDPTSLRVRALEIIGVHYPDLAEVNIADTAAAAIIEHDTRGMLLALQEIAGLTGPLRDRRKLENDLVRALLAQLKDTDVLVGETGAQPGDYLDLIVSSSPDSELPRALHVRFQVREFGLVHRISDSFIFLNRSRDPSPFRGTQDTVSAPYNYVPTAGITFGWTLEHRRNWGGRFLSTAARWLHPGFGFNVSFPRFANQVRQPAAGGGAQLLTDDASADGFDLAVGGVVTLFNGAVQFTYGRNLTADRDKTYWGLGFSFLRTIGEVRQRIGGIQ